MTDEKKVEKSLLDIIQNLQQENKELKEKLENNNQLQISSTEDILEFSKFNDNKRIIVLGQENLVEYSISVEHSVYNASYLDMRFRVSIKRP